MEELRKAQKQLKQALENIKKAEEKLYNNHESDLADKAESMEFEIVRIMGGVEVLNMKSELREVKKNQ